MPRKKSFEGIASVPSPVSVEKTAVMQGFARDISAQKPSPLDDIGKRRIPKRQRTGRDKQLNLKVSSKCRHDLETIADKMDWGLGETLEELIEHWHSTWQK